jgi:hypothetical protein
MMLSELLYSDLVMLFMPFDDISIKLLLLAAEIFGTPLIDTVILPVSEKSWFLSPISEIEVDFITGPFSSPLLTTLRFLETWVSGRCELSALVTGKYTFSSTAAGYKGTCLPLAVVLASESEVYDTTGVTPLCSIPGCRYVLTLGSVMASMDASTGFPLERLDILTALDAVDEWYNSCVPTHKSVLWVGGTWGCASGSSSER